MVFGTALHILSSSTQATFKGPMAGSLWYGYKASRALIHAYDENVRSNTRARDTSLELLTRSRRRFHTLHVQLNVLFKELGTRHQRTNLPVLHSMTSRPQRRRLLSRQSHSKANGRVDTCGKLLPRVLEKATLRPLRKIRAELRWVFIHYCYYEAP